MRALCEAVAHILSKNITCARLRRNATPSNLSSHFLLHTSYCTLHTSHFPSHFTLHPISDHVSTSQSSLYYKACTKHFRVLVCATKLAPRRTFYYKDWTKHFPVLLCGTKLAQSTYQYYFVLQSLHKESFYTQQVLWQRSFYRQQAFETEKLLHTASIYTQNKFTQSAFTHGKRFRTLLHRVLLHIMASVYT